MPSHFFTAQGSRAGGPTYERRMAMQELRETGRPSNPAALRPTATVDFLAECPALAQATAKEEAAAAAAPSGGGPAADIVWVTGWPGTGKSTVGDYLAQSCGFAHVDVDHDFMRHERGKDTVDGWYLSWGAFFKDEEPLEADFGPFLRLVCDFVRAIRRAQPSRRIVVTQGLHRQGRDFVRRHLGDLLFVGLTASHEKNAARLLYKERRYYELSGEDFEAVFEARFGRALTEAAYFEEYMGKRMNRIAKRRGMDTSKGEPNCVRIDVSADDDAVLPRVRSVLGLPKVAGTIDATSAAEANWEKLAITKPWEK